MVTFGTTLSFAAAGSNDVTVLVRATDCEGQSSTTGFIAHHDAGAPIITVDNLQLAPAVNAVVQTPYRLTGLISDSALAGFTIESQSIGVQATGTPGQWSFGVDVPLQRLVDWPLTLEAWDAAGQRSTLEVILRLDANLKLEILSPASGMELLVSSGASQVQLAVTARAIGMATDDAVFAQADSLPRVRLTRSGSSATGRRQRPGECRQAYAECERGERAGSALGEQQRQRSAQRRGQYSTCGSASRACR